MPAPEPDLIVAPPIAPVSIALEPAHNALNSLSLFCKIDRLSGLDEWVTRTFAALTPEQRHTNRLVMFGLHYAVVPDRSWPSFPAYVDHLATQDPLIFRDQVFGAYAQTHKEECCPLPDPTLAPTSIDVPYLLGNVDAFIQFLYERFPEEAVEPDIETEAHRYLNDPPAMQSLIVAHFRDMWEQVLAPEWRRVRPILQASVDAFQQLDISGLSKLEAAQLVTGRDLEEDEREHWKAALEDIERLIFVPCTHLGPYLSKFRSGHTLWMLFGARIPAGVQVHAPDLSRAEILVRLNALADDTRLRILKLIAEEGELRSQVIMARLDLSQSAASRHLKQLSATGYLHERRCEGAKCYDLNQERVEDTLRALSAFLLAK
jgi:DNA-binding transcriptional ArsR family regulator